MDATISSLKMVHYQISAGQLQRKKMQWVLYDRKAKIPRQRESKINTPVNGVNREQNYRDFRCALKMGKIAHLITELFLDCKIASAIHFHHNTKTKALFRQSNKQIRDSCNKVLDFRLRENVQNASTRYIFDIHSIINWRTVVYSLAN